jgi:hypothetical protein
MIARRPNGARFLLGIRFHGPQFVHNKRSPAEVFPPTVLCAVMREAADARILTLTVISSSVYSDSLLTINKGATGFEPYEKPGDKQNGAGEYENHKGERFFPERFY